MNIAFFLTPKKDVVTLQTTMTVRQAMEVMEYHRYAVVPVIDESGKYCYSLSEGDILWYIKAKKELNLKDLEKIGIAQIKRSKMVRAVVINMPLKKAVNVIRFQNYLPVVDDNQIFIGIVKRSDIMEPVLTGRVSMSYADYFSERMHFFKRRLKRQEELVL